jgi:hypothetical protein
MGLTNPAIYLARDVPECFKIKNGYKLYEFILIYFWAVNVELDWVAKSWYCCNEEGRAGLSYLKLKWENIRIQTTETLDNCSHIKRF